MNKWIKKLTAALCAAVLMCGMAVTAYAGGGDMGYPAKSEDFVGRGGATEQSECSPQGGRSGAEFVTTRDGLAPVEPLPTETVDSGEGFTEDGNLVTRDLLYDKATNKQFITVQTSGGNTFYIVIDYDKPTDEDGEQYQTYFLNMVDEADLLAAMQAAGGELPECSCADKCAVGAINTDCIVCAVNMGECQGKAPEPAPVEERSLILSRSSPRAAAGRSCWCWPWRSSAVVLAGISRYTAPRSSRPQTLRRTMATITTIPRLGRMRTKRKARARNEIYQQPL